MKAYALPVSIVFLGLSLLVGVFFYNSQTATGSVSYGADYGYTFVTSADANSTSTLNAARGSLGSIIVSDASTAGVISLYATSTAGMRQATSSNDLVFTFDTVAATEGTYTYDVWIPHGAVMDVSTGFDGDIVITTR